MLFWHVGATTAFIRYAFRDPAMDLRFLALGAIAADLIDLPIGIVMWDTFRSVRLAAHSLVFGAAAMVGVLVFTRRGADKEALDASRSWRVGPPCVRCDVAES